MKKKSLKVGSKCYLSIYQICKKIDLLDSKYFCRANSNYLLNRACIS